VGYPQPSPQVCGRDLTSERCYQETAGQLFLGLFGFITDKLAKTSELR